MTSREQTQALVLLGVILLTVAGAGGYLFVWQPLQKQKTAEETLNNEIADLEAQLKAQKKTAKDLAVARVRSLPADEAMAKREYTVALGRLAEAAGVPKGYTISPKTVENNSRTVPEIAKGKPVYTRIAFEMVFKKADMWAVKDFLEGYYKLGLLHQITALSIKKDDDPSSKNAGRRNDLTVTLVSEAILVDGAENRRTLLPVPTAFAAAGGGALQKALSVSPEAARGVVPEILVPVLSTTPRDYTLMVKRDPFNGPLPDPAPPDRFRLAEISDVKVKTDEVPSPVKVRVSGDGATGATVTAIVKKDSALFAEGALKVDPKTLAIELPKTSATEGVARIAVVATSADGKVTKETSFRVSIEKPTESSPPPGEDISTFVTLIGVTAGSDGTAWARISDTANRIRYQINATKEGITVSKEELAPEKGKMVWKPLAEHKDQSTGVMVVSAPESKTNRTFKLIAVDADGLIVADLRPDGSAAPKPPPRDPWAPRGAPPKQGPGKPMAALGGNMIVPPPAPKYYRWGVGQSLAVIKPLSDSEAKKILKQAETSGPVFDAVASDR